MKKIFFTPGPSQLYPTLKEHINTALKEGVCSISHRGAQFADIYKNTKEEVKKILGVPDNFNVIYISSATKAMEIVVKSCAKKHTFHFINGAFGQRFFEVSKKSGRKPLKYEVAAGEEFDVRNSGIPKNTELICFTHNETSTGGVVPLDTIYKVGTMCPDALIAVDIVSSAPYVNLDFNKVDFVFFSVQKGFGMPAGLGVALANERAIEKAKFLNQIACCASGYFNLVDLHEKAQKYQTIETPNVLAIYLLGKICDDLLKKGIENIRKETEEKANLIYGALDGHPVLKPFITDNRLRSKTVIAVEGGSRAAGIINQLAARGFIVGKGYGEYRDKHTRIANFPAHTVENARELVNLLNGLM